MILLQDEEADIDEQSTKQGVFSDIKRETHTFLLSLFLSHCAPAPGQGGHDMALAVLSLFGFYTDLSLELG